MKKFFHSFSFAAQGVVSLIKNERNAKVHVLAAAISIYFGFWFQISKMEWSLVILCIAGVMGAEAFNTSIEALSNALHPEQHPKIKLVKDLAAGAVLIVSFGALLIGVLIFLPHIFFYF